MSRMEVKNWTCIPSAVYGTKELWIMYPSMCIKGEVVGISGLMGAGRSTELAMSIFGNSYGTKYSAVQLYH